MVLYGNGGGHDPIARPVSLPRKSILHPRAGRPRRALRTQNGFPPPSTSPLQFSPIPDILPLRYAARSGEGIP